MLIDGAITAPLNLLSKNFTDVLDKKMLWQTQTRRPQESRYYRSEHYVSSAALRPRLACIPGKQTKEYQWTRIGQLDLEIIFRPFYIPLLWRATADSTQNQPADRVNALFFHSLISGFVTRLFCGVHSIRQSHPSGRQLVVSQSITFSPSASRPSCILIRSSRPLIWPPRLRLSDHRVCTSSPSCLARKASLFLCCSCRVQRYRFVYNCWFIGGYWCHWREYFAIYAFYSFCRAQFDKCVYNFWFAGGSCCCSFCRRFGDEKQRQNMPYRYCRWTPEQY